MTEQETNQPKSNHLVQFEQHYQNVLREFEAGYIDANTALGLAKDAVRESWKNGLQACKARAGQNGKGFAKKAKPERTY